MTNLNEFPVDAGTGGRARHLSVSRMLDFFTVKELSMQAGSSPDTWGLLLIKELTDNALDACEAAGIAPEIVVEVTPDRIVVSDNGLGLPAAVVARSLDFSVRVSDKSLRVCPSRGQLGNALKLAYAMPFVMDGASLVEIEAQGHHHRIAVSLDRIKQTPVIDHQMDGVAFGNSKK